MIFSKSTIWNSFWHFYLYSLIHVANFIMFFKNWVVFLDLKKCYEALVFMLFFFFFLARNSRLLPNLEPSSALFLGHFGPFYYCTFKPLIVWREGFYYDFWRRHIFHPNSRPGSQVSFCFLFSNWQWDQIFFPDHLHCG